MFLGGGGDFMHCFWSCGKILRFWSDVATVLSVIFIPAVPLDPLVLILGVMDNLVF